MTDKDVIISRLNGRIHWQRTTLLQKQVCIKKYKLKNRILRELLEECQNTLGVRFNADRGYCDDLIKRIEKVLR